MQTTNPFQTILDELGEVKDLLYSLKKEPEIEQKGGVFYSNLCKEIPLGPMMECTLGMQNTAYSYQELYEKVIYPKFQGMLKETISLEIHHMSQFDDRAFELLKMAKIY